MIYRSQCEELRSTMSKRTQDEVSAELVFQMREKLEFEKQKEAENKFYADLWEADMMAKVGVSHIVTNSIAILIISSISLMRE